MEEKAYIVLIFVATTLCCGLLMRMLVQFTQERLELGEGGAYPEISRFIEPRKFISLRFLFALSTFASIFIIQLLFGVEKMYIAVPVAIFASVVTWKLVLKYFLWKARKHREEFESKIVDLTMGLANAMKSGLAVGQAVASVAKRIGEPMKEELAALLLDVRHGDSFAEAFEKLARRMPGEDMNLLATSIAICDRSGGSLVPVLNEMSDVIRKRTEFHERLKSMTAQGRYEALVISLAPVAAFVLFYLIDPVLMRPLVQTWIGWCAIGVAGTLIYTGYKVLLKITNVEV